MFTPMMRSSQARACSPSRASTGMTAPRRVRAFLLMATATRLVSVIGTAFGRRPGYALGIPSTRTDPRCPPLSLCPTCCQRLLGQVEPRLGAIVPSGASSPACSPFRRTTTAAGWPRRPPANGRQSYGHTAHGFPSELSLGPERYENVAPPEPIWSIMRLRPNRSSVWYSGLRKGESNLRERQGLADGIVVPRRTIAQTNRAPSTTAFLASG